MGNPTGAISLKNTYQLTPAEARVAVALTQEQSLDEIADSFQVSKNTIRAQLRVVFEKTGTSRQAELVKLLLSG